LEVEGVEKVWEVQEVSEVQEVWEVGSSDVRLPSPPTAGRMGEGLGVGAGYT
jgi:hypothetical protein